MNTSPLSKAEKDRLWLETRQLLHTILYPRITAEMIDATAAQTPMPKPGERFGDWLRRIPQAGVEAEFFHLAAETAKTSKKALILEPFMKEFKHKRFRLNASAEGGELLLTVQAIGPAISQCAGQRFGLSASPEALEVFATVTLDRSGRGDARIADNEDHRQALLNPCLRRMLAE